MSDEANELYQQRCSEISPNIRYCEYNIGDESAAEDLMQMRRQIGGEDPLTSRLDVWFIRFGVHLSALEFSVVKFRGIFWLKIFHETLKNLFFD